MAFSIVTLLYAHCFVASVFQCLCHEFRSIQPSPIPFPEKYGILNFLLVNPAVCYGEPGLQARRSQCARWDSAIYNVFDN